MIKVLFFAQTREMIGEEGINLAIDSILAKDLVAQLAAKGGNWQAALSSDKLLVAVNQEMVSMDSEIKAGDEVAFFPPVTGG